MIDQLTFNKLCTYDWGQIILDLTLYAEDKLKILKTAKVKLPLTHEPSDYAKEAVRLVFDGTRHWDSSRHPDIVKFLKYSVIKSLIYNERISPGVKKRVENTITVKEDDDDEEEISLTETTESKEPLPDLLLIEQQTLKSIRTALDGDDDACIVLEELLKSKKPAEIAQDLGIKIDDIRSIIKRIRRKAKGAIED